MLVAHAEAPVRKLALVSESSGRVVGFVAGRVVLDEAEVENIFVATDFQRQGIARALLHALAETCREAGAKELRLEVREGNAPARTFYQSAGFAITGRRAGYYLDPEEDALLLSLQL
jgi:ribosomal-protein-alanine N-acetyltransferase